jgi:hypothetical protein
LAHYSTHTCDTCGLITGGLINDHWKKRGLLENTPNRRALRWSVKTVRLVEHAVSDGVVITTLSRQSDKIFPPLNRVFLLSVIHNTLLSKLLLLFSNQWFIYCRKDGNSCMPKYYMSLTYAILSKSTTPKQSVVVC